MPLILAASIPGCGRGSVLLAAIQVAASDSAERAAEVSPVHIALLDVEWLLEPSQETVHRTVRLLAGEGRVRPGALSQDRCGATPPRLPVPRPVRCGARMVELP